MAVRVEKYQRGLKAVTCVGQMASHQVAWSHKVCYEYCSDIQHSSVASLFHVCQVTMPPDNTGETMHYDSCICFVFTHVIKISSDAFFFYSVTDGGCVPKKQKTKTKRQLTLIFCVSPSCQQEE